MVTKLKCYFLFVLSGFKKCRFEHSQMALIPWSRKCEWFLRRPLYSLRLWFPSCTRCDWNGHSRFGSVTPWGIPHRSQQSVAGKSCWDLEIRSQFNMVLDPILQEEGKPEGYNPQSSCLLTGKASVSPLQFWTFSFDNLLIEHFHSFSQKSQNCKHLILFRYL